MKEKQRLKEEEELRERKASIRVSCARCMIGRIYGLNTIDSYSSSGAH